MSGKILIVDDEPPIRQLLKLALTTQKYTAIEAENGYQALDILEAQKDIRLGLLDWMLPDMSGIELLSRLRKHELLKQIPIIMLTAKAEENNVLRGFSAGADDYITKPFSPKELIARIQALLKRTYVNPDKVQLSFHELTLDHEARKLFFREESIKCGRLEFNLLSYFFKNKNKTLSRAHLLDKVWSRDKEVTERTVDVHVRRVRKLLAPYGYDKYIFSVRGEGYQMADKL